MAGLIIAPRARIFHGHEWVYATEIRKSFGDPQPGDVVTLKDFRDRPLGSAIFNPVSQIVARRFSRRRQDLDLDFFTRRIRQGLKLFNRQIKNYASSDALLLGFETRTSSPLPFNALDPYHERVLAELFRTRSCSSDAEGAFQMP